MKLETKKIIAREFLFLMLCFGIGLLAFFITYFYIYNQKIKSQRILSEIINKDFIADSLMKPFDEKIKQQEWFYNKNNDKVDLSASAFDSPEKLWHRMDDLAIKDSIVKKYQSVWSAELKGLFSEIGFNNPEKLQAFIDKNRITNDDKSNYEKAKIIRTETNSMKSMVSNHHSNFLYKNTQFQFGLWAFIFSLIIFFAIRYILYSINWSLKILKQK